MNVGTSEFGRAFSLDRGVTGQHFQCDYEVWKKAFNLGTGLQDIIFRVGISLEKHSIFIDTLQDP